jgi:PAS domain S-box-containing protein
MIGRGSMKTRHKVIGLTVLLCVLAWVIDGLLDFWIFYADRPFIDMLVLDVPGHEVYVRIVWMALVLAAGSVLAVHLSRLEKASEALRVSQEWYSTTLGSIGDAVIASDTEGRVTFMNAVAESLTGWKKSEALGRPTNEVFRVFNELTGEPAANPVDRVLSEGVIVGLVNHTELETRNGNRIPIDDSGAPIRSKDGTLVGVVLVFHDMSKRRTLERELARNEAKYKFLVENLNEGIWQIDREGNTVFVNQRMAEMLGYTIDEVVGKSPQSFMEEKGAELWQQRLEMRRRGVGERYDLEFVRKDGSHFFASLNASPINDDVGRMTGALAAVVDVTERRTAEDRVVHLNAVLKAIRNVSQLITRVHDLDSLIRQICECLVEARGFYSAWIALLDESGNLIARAQQGFDGGFDRIANQFAESRGPHCWLKAQKDPAAALMIVPHQECGDCSATDCFSERRVLCTCLKHGERIYGILNISIPAEFEHDEEELSLFREVAGDIAFALHALELAERRRQAEIELASEKEKLAVTLGSIGDGVIATDSTGRVEFLNRVAEDLTGWSEKEALGRVLTEVFRIVNEQTREECENPVERVLRAGEVVGLANHTALISRSGIEKSIADSGAPIRDLSGSIIGVVLVFRDVSETKRLQEFVNRAQRLETAGRIAGQVAHDFNNLLGPLTAYPLFVRELLPDNHPAIEFIDEIERSAGRIAEINQQLLTLGRRGHYAMSTLDLNEVVSHALEQMKPIQETLLIETVFERNLLPVRGGAAQLVRVISNLVSNAADAMLNIGKIVIKTESYYAESIVGRNNRVPKGEYVKLSVIDSGVGIPQDVVPKIFDPFFSTKSEGRQRGSGLGLSVVHAVVEDHDGHVDFESKVGHGSSFYVYLPVSREGIEDEPSESIAGGKETILVVDDDGVQRDICHKLLEKLGYSVTVVRSGEAAVVAAKESRFDLMLLDMIMPDGIDGAEAYRRILQVRPNQKAIVVSGYAETERVQRALDLGAGAFIRKPLSLKSIAQAVRKELDRAREYQQKSSDNS